VEHGHDGEHPAHPDAPEPAAGLPVAVRRHASGETLTVYLVIHVDRLRGDPVAAVQRPAVADDVVEIGVVTDFQAAAALRWTSLPARVPEPGHQKGRARRECREEDQEDEAHPVG
jgi:hypothetical protein